MPRQKAFPIKTYYGIFLLIDASLWFVALPVLVSLSVFDVFLYLHMPTIQEYLIWQVFGFATTWIAVHVSLWISKRR